MDAYLQVMYSEGYRIDDSEDPSVANSLIFHNITLLKCTMDLLKFSGFIDLYVSKLKLSCLCSGAY